MTDGLSEAYEAKQWDVFCENNDLRLENDQLRELVEDMWQLLSDFKAREVPHSEMKAVCARMRKLGVDE